MRAAKTKENTMSTNQLRSDPRIGFIKAMRNAGIDCDEPEKITADGILTRFHV